MKIECHAFRLQTVDETVTAAYRREIWVRVQTRNPHRSAGLRATTNRLHNQGNQRRRFQRFYRNDVLDIQGRKSICLSSRYIHTVMQNSFVDLLAC
ncbi:hypothetical protein Mp_2g02520 [Marchantia polymorpha subsp. ruderalis]|uniref:Uncharacterized protein n=1 Tax=Marchantia polymorpha TaxID=3197 RepID=A0A2R6WM06_MARPO|nr:hypothetical protein MARPO_0075s0014 [Marchantia polymorpha]BBN00834.1 hypothetical protein Mp_2g02520 [Marchantia polymorpha subsp. ruderalis]|eukprot:PTQ34887.1 hypothetical protein MARPO_0075s0014 [Marchantia polymorpha]